MNFFYGFCMALADSMPGVSGGTIAFILGFYEDLLDSINNVVSREKEKRKESLAFLIKLLIGWVIGFIISVTLLSSMFENNIYFLSSLFIGLTSASIIYIGWSQRRMIEKRKSYLLFTIFGICLVVCISMFRGKIAADGNIVFSQLNLAECIYIFFTGMLAISAMVLPGISGSTLLLIFGVYMPIINTIKSLMGLDFSGILGIISFGLGIIFGMVFSVRLIRQAFMKYRSRMIYFIIGLTIGSIYAIIHGPMTLEVPKAAVNLSNFNIIGFLLGIGILLGLEGLKVVIYKRNN